MKKLYSEKNVYLFKEAESEEHDGVYYGHVVLLSTKVGVNKKTGAKSGHYNYFSNKPVRVVSKEDVRNIEEPTELEKEFVERLKNDKTISYSKKLVDEYGIGQYVRFYEIDPKEVEDE